MRHHGFASELNESLVDTAHPAGKAASQNDACNAHDASAFFETWKRSAPVNSRKCLPCERPIMVMPTLLATSQPMRVSPERDTRKGTRICAALMTISLV